MGLYNVLGSQSCVLCDRVSNKLQHPTCMPGRRSCDGITKIDGSMNSRHANALLCNICSTACRKHEECETVAHEHIVSRIYDRRGRSEVYHVLCGLVGPEFMTNIVDYILRKQSSVENKPSSTPYTYFVRFQESVERTQLAYDKYKTDFPNRQLQQQNIYKETNNPTHYEFIMHLLDLSKRLMISDPEDYGMCSFLPRLLTSFYVENGASNPIQEIRENISEEIQHRIENPSQYPHDPLCSVPVHSASALGNMPLAHDSVIQKLSQFENDLRPASMVHDGMMLDTITRSVRRGWTYLTERLLFFTYAAQTREPMHSEVALGVMYVEESGVSVENIANGTVELTLNSKLGILDTVLKMFRDYRNFFSLSLTDSRKFIEHRNLNFTTMKLVQDDTKAHACICLGGIYEARIMSAYLYRAQKKYRIDNIEYIKSKNCQLYNNSLTGFPLDCSFPVQSAIAHVVIRKIFKYVEDSTHVWRGFFEDNFPGERYLQCKENIHQGMVSTFTNVQELVLELKKKDRYFGSVLAEPSEYHDKFIYHLNRSYCTLYGKENLKTLWSLACDNFLNHFNFTWEKSNQDRPQFYSKIQFQDKSCLFAICTSIWNNNENNPSRSAQNRTDTFTRGIDQYSKTSMFQNLSADVINIIKTRVLEDDRNIYDYNSAHCPDVPLCWYYEKCDERHDKIVGFHTDIYWEMFFLLAYCEAYMLVEDDNGYLHYDAIKGVPYGMRTDLHALISCAVMLLNLAKPGQPVRQTDAIERVHEILQSTLMSWMFNDHITEPVDSSREIYQFLTDIEEVVQHLF